MRRLFRLLIVIICSFSTLLSAAQTKCTDPLEPILKLVTVQPEDGATYLEWNLSPSPGIAAYIIHKFHNGIGTPDTIWNPAATSFTYNDVETKYYSLSYSISALRLPDCESPLSNSISTIFIVPELDTCKKEITLKWNNYTDVPKKILRYEVYAINEGSASTEIYNTDARSTDFTIINFKIDEEYCFIVKAVLEDGSISESVKKCLTTKMTRPPAWINADFATVTSEEKIMLSYTIDPLSEINRFRLEKKSGYGDSFHPVTELTTANGHISYIDDQADIRNINFYRLSALNNCSPPVKVSNLSSNIVAVLSGTGSELHLTWNPYKSWMGTISGYRLLINKGEGYSELAFIQPADTSYTLSYNDIISGVTGKEICFRIVASEAGNPYGINGESTSSEACILNSEVITVPDLFTPDGDEINDLFKPVLSFVPVKYHLMISDRRGKVVFDTIDDTESWDGSYGGDPLPQDVYLWFLKTTGPSGKTYSRTGTITTYRNR